MDGFGMLGDIFANENLHAEEVDSSQKSLLKYETPSEYTPPDILDSHQSIDTKQQKSASIETLIPVTIKQIVDNIVEGNQKLKLYNKPIVGMCIVGMVYNIEKLASGVNFQLQDATGTINVTYTNETFDALQGDCVQVVGSLIILSTDNFNIDAQHVLNYGNDPNTYEPIVKYHYTRVAYVAFNLDIASKLELQNKHIGKVALPGDGDVITIEKLEKVELDKEHAHIDDMVEILVLKYLKAHNSLARKQDIFNCLTSEFVESVIEKAISNLESESEIVCEKGFISLTICE
ncbi:Nucleic acid-binding [Babesia duncani]|uniref:Nucleic acid-binding n=1 Tax=Babesia duncani TaxID=323732 RepID=A0AAD9PIK5_9APIC|nr:Nucleic acid-binding [Babesia duncani]